MGCGSWMVSMEGGVVRGGKGSHFADEVIFLFDFLFGVVFGLVFFSGGRGVSYDGLEGNCRYRRKEAHNLLSRMPIDLLTCTQNRS